MKFIAGIVALILCVVVFSFASDYNEYIEITRKYYISKQNDVNVIKNWKEGLAEGYQVELDHLTMDFEFVKGYETTDGKTIIAGVLTITAYCIKDGSKIRISQLAAMAILFTKDKKVEKSVKIKDGEQHIIEQGWYGNFV